MYGAALRPKWIEAGTMTGPSSGGAIDIGNVDAGPPQTQGSCCARCQCQPAATGTISAAPVLRKRCSPKASASTSPNGTGARRWSRLSVGAPPAQGVFPGGRSGNRRRPAPLHSNSRRTGCRCGHCASSG
ncbi:hypothetical protein RHECNPAF_1740058 [Rhizobium etli CNPAF512]|nr:hypothetical protein RHECNPAF_1740058 [Rhizobium etli CNPAF512]